MLFFLRWLILILFFPLHYNDNRIDTLKTRMQSPQGFLKAGGFRGIYNGLGAAAAGSAPGAALFFSTYEVRNQTKKDPHIFF